MDAIKYMFETIIQKHVDINPNNEINVKELSCLLFNILPSIGLEDNIRRLSPPGLNVDNIINLAREIQSPQTTREIIGRDYNIIWDSGVTGFDIKFMLEMLNQDWKCEFINVPSDVRISFAKAFNSIDNDGGDNESSMLQLKLFISVLIDNNIISPILC